MRIQEHWNDSSFEASFPGPVSNLDSFKSLAIIVINESSRFVIGLKPGRACLGRTKPCTIECFYPITSPQRLKRENSGKAHFDVLAPFPRTIQVSGGRLLFYNTYNCRAAYPNHVLP